MDNALKRTEEQKRDRAYNAADRWRHIQETITWAEANLPPEKRRNRPRTRPNTPSERDCPPSEILAKEGGNAQSPQ